MSAMKPLSIAATVVLCARLGLAATMSWTNAAGGTWSDVSSWSNAVPGASDMAYFNLDNPTMYTVSSVPGGTVIQRFRVAQDKVKLELAGACTLSSYPVIDVSTSGTTGTLEIVGGSITMGGKHIWVGAGCRELMTLTVTVRPFTARVLPLRLSQDLDISGSSACKKPLADSLAGAGPISIDLSPLRRSVAHYRSTSIRLAP